MSRYKAYPEYKATNHGWLNTIPFHWKMLPLKYLTASKVTDGPHETPAFITDGIPFLSVDGIQNNKLVFEGCRYISPEDHERYSVKCKPNNGDVLLGKAASVGKVAYVDADVEFNVWSPLAVIKPQCKKTGKFIYYSFQSALLQMQCDMYSNANTQKNLGMNTIDNLSLACPTEDEAVTIANFLDHETAKIDALIEKQQRLIELLKEKRQAVISHAVTKGLNPNAPMKDSGVEWLGEVPAHWAVKKFGYISMVVRGGSPRPAGDPALFNGDYSPWVTVAEITKDDEVYLGETETFLTKKGSDQCRVFSKGTLLISNSGATLGVPKILDINANANDGVVGFERLTLNHEFAYFYLSTLTEDLRERVKQGSGQPNLNTDIVKTITVPVPPDNEVEKIVYSIRITRERFNSLMEKAAKGIELLKERRTALISAAVTGKIDVRDWQAAA